MRVIVRSAALIAFSVACGYAKLLLFPFLFFVEIFSVAVFLSGAVAGAFWGAWIGAVSRLIFSVANPMGPPHPWVLGAQVLAAAFVGLWGGVAGGALLRAERGRGIHPGIRIASLVVAAAVATIAHDLVTNVAHGLTIGSVRASLVLGLLPSIQHLASNIAIFVVVGVLALPWLSRHPAAFLVAVAMLGAGPAEAQVADHARTEPRDSIVVERGFLDRARARGIVTPEDPIRLRQPALVRLIPLEGSRRGLASLPDAGSPFGVDARRLAATDRTPIVAWNAWLGAPDLAVTLDDPIVRGIEPIERADGADSLASGAFMRAGALLLWDGTQPIAARATRGPRRESDRARSTLSYRRGDHGALDTDVRVLAPSLGRGLAAMYARHEADGIVPVLESVSQRYALAAALPAPRGTRVVASGAFFEQRLDDESLGLSFEPRAGRAEWRERSAAVAIGPERDHAWSVSVSASEEKRTQVHVDTAVFPFGSDGGGRERWKASTLAADALCHASGGGWRFLGGLHASSTRLVYREGSAPAFDRRLESTRVTLGARRSLASGIGAGLDLACDARESEPAEWEARASGSYERSELAVRVDLESATERPSWVDRLSPDRVRIVGPSEALPQTVRYGRSGDASITPRRLSGGLGRLTWTPVSGFTATLSGAIRSVQDDFGWGLDVVSDPETLYVTERAARRGSGTLAHAGLQVRLEREHLLIEAVGWARSPAGGLAPRAGDPERRGLDALIETRGTLLRGGLPLALSLEAHAAGPRGGFVSAPAEVVWDGALRATVGDAEAYMRMSNLFDRAVPSAVIDVTEGRAVPMPGREIAFGVTWDFMD